MTLSDWYQVGSVALLFLTFVFGAGAVLTGIARQPPIRCSREQNSNSHPNRNARQTPERRLFD